MSKGTILNEVKRYKKYLKKEAKKFKLTEDDLSNLYDFFYMIDLDSYQTFKLNKMEDWYKKFFVRIEKIVIPELYENNKTLKEKIKNRMEKR